MFSNNFIYLFLLVTLSEFLGLVLSARILCIFPMPSLSHHFVFRRLTLELSNRGHDLVIVTPNPLYQNGSAPLNYKEIDTSDVYVKAKMILSSGEPLRGVVVPVSKTSPNSSIVLLSKVAEDTMNNENFQTFIQDESHHFDLVISEAWFTFPLVLAKKYNAPSIWLSSFYGMEWNFNAVGAPTSHAFLYPNVFRNHIYGLSLFDKIYELYIEFRLWYTFSTFAQYELNFMKKYMNVPTDMSYQDVCDNVDMLFLNVYWFFHANRPVPPNVVFLGGLHLGPVKDLPQDLLSFLDNSERGVIYISMGSNMLTSYMKGDLMDTIIKCLNMLPFDILWKYDSETLPELINNNVKISKWFPQRDLLHHPNVRAFVTHGGLLSTDEAIDAGVPLVCLPTLGDQWFNAQHYVKFGIGKQLKTETFTANDLYQAIIEVATNVSYRHNLQKLATIIKDQPQSALERAIWWTEYVIRNKGAKHLSAASANLSWAEYLEVRLILLIILILTLIMTILTLSILGIYRIIYRNMLPSKSKIL